MGIYRDRYVRIKEAHPDYGRYRYRQGYRSDERYRDPKDYEASRSGVKQGSPREVKPGEQPEVREKDAREPGNKKERKGEKRKGPRDNRSRLTLPGGVS